MTDPAVVIREALERARVALDWICMDSLECTLATVEANIENDHTATKFREVLAALNELAALAVVGQEPREEVNEPRFTPSPDAPLHVLEARVGVAFTYPHGHPGIPGIPEGKGCPRCNAEKALEELCARVAVASPGEAPPPEQDLGGSQSEPCGGGA